MSLRVVRTPGGKGTKRKTSVGSLGVSEGPFRQVQALRPHEDVVAQIVQAIRTGRLSTGDKLPSERDLAAVLEVSRQTVREAVQALVGHGVLKVEPGRAGGAYVMTDTIPLHVTSRGRALNANEVGEWLESWRAVAPRVAQLAGMRATPNDLTYLESIITDLRAAIGDEELFHLLEEKFQIGIARAAGNRVLLQWVQTMLDLNGATPDFTLAETPADPVWAVESLERILRAIADRDPQVIERELDRHLTYLEQTWSELSGHAPLRQIPEFLLPYDLRRQES